MKVALIALIVVLAVFNAAWLMLVDMAETWNQGYGDDTAPRQRSALISLLLGAADILLIAFA